jgi:hypothetical protein
MQIDFHFGVTYVLARLAKFNEKDAYTIACSSQYVDDATNSGLIKFTDGSMYSHISSANAMLDSKNIDQYADHLAWLPFHFLPGNAGLPAGQGCDLPFVDRVLCKPNSFIARDMVAESIRQKNSKHGLHRFGITMHVYADTWAHQGFAGIIDDINRVRNLDTAHDSLRDGALEIVMRNVTLGHGGALTFPDRPYLQWSYIDNRKNLIKRDNPAEYSKAIDQLFIAMRRYINGFPAAPAENIPAACRQKIIDMLMAENDPDADQRLTSWIAAIGDGTFGFSEKIEYIPKGKGSWKHAALGTDAEEDDASWKYDFSPSFLDSDWRLFHDALQAHRLYVLTELLPDYGISAA